MVAMLVRAPQWLLMFCSGWTLFTLVNVTWQPLMVFQLALIWGGYAFLAPRGLPQRTFWKSSFWESMQHTGMKPARVIHPEPQSLSLQPMSYSQPNMASARSNQAAPTVKRQRPRTSKKTVSLVFATILVISIFVHLMPFNYNSIIAQDEIARAVGGLIALFIISRLGLLYRPNPTLGVILIAVVLAPVIILLDRSSDPVAPRYFRDLLHLNQTGQSNIPLPDTRTQNVKLPVSNTDDPAEQNNGEADTDYRRLLNKFLAADPATNPDFYHQPSTPEQKRLEQQMGAVDEATQQNQSQRHQEMLASIPDGYSLATMRATGEGITSATQRDRDFLAMTPNGFRERYGDDVGEAYSAAFSQGEAIRRSNLQN